MAIRAATRALIIRAGIRAAAVGVALLTLGSVPQPLDPSATLIASIGLAALVVCPWARRRRSLR